MFLWISGVLNDKFVFNFCGLASLPFHPQRSRFLQYVSASACQSHAFSHISQISVNNISIFPHCSLSSKILPVFFENCIFEPDKFLIRALSLLLNGTLHHRYIVTALKIIIYDNIICFCLQTSEMYSTLNII